MQPENMGNGHNVFMAGQEEKPPSRYRGRFKQSYTPAEAQARVATAASRSSPVAQSGAVGPNLRMHGLPGSQQFEAPAKAPSSSDAVPDMIKDMSVSIPMTRALRLCAQNPQAKQYIQGLMMQAATESEIQGTESESQKVGQHPFQAAASPLPIYDKAAAGTDPLPVPEQAKEDPKPKKRHIPIHHGLWGSSAGAPRRKQSFPGAMVEPTVREPLITPQSTTPTTGEMDTGTDSRKPTTGGAEPSVIDLTCIPSEEPLGTSAHLSCYPKRGGSLQVLVEVEGENVFAYLDTGATFCVMSQRLVEKIGLQPHIEPEEGTYSTASGHEEKPVGKIRNVVILINGIKYCCDFTVTAAESYSMLLGTNFLIQVKPQFDWSEQTLSLQLPNDADLRQTVPLIIRDRCGPINGFTIWHENPLDYLKEFPLEMEQQAEKLYIEERCIIHERGQGGCAKERKEHHTSSEAEPAVMLNRLDENGDADADVDEEVVDVSSKMDQSKPSEVFEEAEAEKLEGECSMDEPPVKSRYVDKSDWQILPKFFHKYNTQYGPFSIDACADKQGRNAMVPRFWSIQDDCRKADWCHENAWANPPFHIVQDMMEQFLACKRLFPNDTSAVMMVPAQKEQPWWRSVEKHFLLADYYPAYSEVFTGSPLRPGEARRAVGPVPWPLVVIWCPPGPLLETTSKAGAGEFATIPGPTEKQADYEYLGKIHVNPTLSEEQGGRLKRLLEEHPHAFANKLADLSRTTLTKHRIDTGNATPISRPAYRHSKTEEEHINQAVSELQELGLVERSLSPWSVPVVLVPKKDSAVPRMCQDYRPVNAVTKSDRYPMPDVDEALSSFGQAQYFSTIDLKSGYYQVPMAAEDEEKTAFITKQGLFHFKVMPFGLKNAPATFQRLMHEVLEGLNYVKVHIDDIIIFSESFETHLDHLETVLLRLEMAGLKATPGKCHFAMEELTYLGHIVSVAGYAPDPAKIAAIRDAVSPTNKHEVLVIHGLMSYYRKFIRHFAQIAQPITNLLEGKTEDDFEWTDECEAAYRQLKKALINAPVLIRPNLQEPFILQTDWQPYAIGAVLSQMKDGQEHPVAYASKKLTSHERNWTPSEGECFAVVWAVKKFRPFLHGSRFTLQTDHHALKWLMTTTDLTGKLARWSLRLQEYDFEITYRPGKFHVNADSLSRLPMKTPSTDETATDDGDGFEPLGSIMMLHMNYNPTAEEVLENLLTWPGHYAAAEWEGRDEVAEPRMEMEEGVEIEDDVEKVDGAEEVDDEEAPPDGEDESLATEQQNDEENTISQDIWEDAATIMYIKSRSYPSGLNKKRKTRIRMRAARYKFQDNGQDELAMQDSMQDKLHRLEEMVQQNNYQAQQTQSRKALAHRMKKAAGRKPQTLPAINTFVKIRATHINGKLKKQWEPGIFKLVAYNSTQTVATLQTKAGSTWTESVDHIKPFP